MTDKPLAAHPDAYKAGLIAAGIPNGPRVHVSDNTQITDAISQADDPQGAIVKGLNDAPDAPMVGLLKAANDVAQAQAQEAANISAERIAQVRAECIADTSALIAGQYLKV